MGRVGRGLRSLAEGAGAEVQPVCRELGWETIEAGGTGPILVCVNAGDLEAVIDGVPRERRPDLVFVQNGMLDTFLDGRGCARNTRGLLYFAVPSLGAAVQPGGASIFTGEHSEAIVHWFRLIGLEADVVDRMKFGNQMASKLIWNCTFGLLCDVYDEPVDLVVERHRDDVGVLVSELIQISNRSIGTTLNASETTEHLCTYSASLQGYRATLKQWTWRNGWFVEAAMRLGHAGQIHRDQLAERRRRCEAVGSDSSGSF
jgi:hypothetical protein